MSAMAPSSSGNLAHEERSRKALILAAKGVNDQGHDLLDSEANVSAAAAALKDLEERNPELLKVSANIVMKYLVFLFGLVCVYGIDVLLFGATAEYVASLLTGNGFLVLLAKYGIPLFFLGIEVLISLKMIEAREEREEVQNYGW